MALRLTLIAHARTLAQKQARFALDEPIEVERVSAKDELKTLFGRRARFLCAPELRTQQTGALFSEQLEIDATLRDCDFGAWKGRSVDDIDPVQMGAWLADWQAAPHGGESIQHVLQRVSGWMDALSGTGHLVAITHPFVIRAALVNVLNCPPESFHAIDIEPLSAVDLRFNGRWRMRAVSLCAF